MAMTRPTRIASARVIVAKYSTTRCRSHRRADHDAPTADEAATSGQDQDGGPRRSNAPQSRATTYGRAGSSTPPRPGPSSTRTPGATVSQPRVAGPADRTPTTRVKARSPTSPGRDERFAAIEGGDADPAMSLLLVEPTRVMNCPESASTSSPASPPLLTTAIRVGKDNQDHRDRPRPSGLAVATTPPVDIRASRPSGRASRAASLASACGAATPHHHAVPAQVVRNHSRSLKLL